MKLTIIILTMYSLSLADLSNFGFHGGKQANSDIALSGFLDMPARLGKTFHSWAEEDSIEPYVNANEIFFSGRSINLTGYIQGSDIEDCSTKAKQLYNYIDGFTGLVPLTSNWGTYSVYVDNAIVGERLSSRLLKITIPMREPLVNISGATLPVTNAKYGIDGISFKDMGAFSLELSGDRFNRPAPRNESITSYAKESFVIAKKDPPVLTLKLAILDPTFSGLKDKVQSLMALLAKPGLRTLNYNNDFLRSFFVKDGFTVSGIRTMGASKLCFIDIKITEIINSSTVDLIDLLDNESYRILDSEGNTLKLFI
ncbi:hypothetical protein [Pedobacter sp. Leaf170]|uniref:hypothetical protein n=1 Tax=Pedobacter sp. Leaf170 TaxID=2876558 RepID=UPI001E2C60EB|nr:hypothetical protein [Pedobacter sp. Leaf170]